jgi:cyclic beta-1,2-glucan synthetase
LTSAVEQLIRRLGPIWPRKAANLWQDPAPIRADLFGPERLEHHARTLAEAQQDLSGRPPRVQPLSWRLKQNAKVLIKAEQISAQALAEGRVVPPAADWLMDNFHIVEAQLRQITDDLPPGYYRQLPKLRSGPLAGYPQVFGIAWAYVAHTDSLISAPVLKRFVHAYQQVQPLTIGELWAIAISLRVVLIENMRRLSVQITEGLALRAEADLLVDRVLGSDTVPPVPLHIALAPWDTAFLPQITAAQVAKRLRGLDPRDTPLLGWLEDRLARQDLTLDEVVQAVQARQGASNVTMRNIVTSMRLLSEIDWAEFVEEVSLIDQRLRAQSDFAAMDFTTRNAYRTAIEEIARGSGLSESAVTEAALAQAAAAEDFPERDPGHALIGASRPDLERATGFAPPPLLRLQRAVQQASLAGYLGAIGGIAIFIGLALWPFGGQYLWLALLGLPLGVEAATALVNLFVTRLLGPVPLPGLDLSKGVPDSLRTLIAVPVLLTSADEVQEMIERLEVHHLSSAGGALHYALLSDGPDAETEVTEADGPLIAAAQAGIARLNASYPAPDGDRFLLLHRHRRWNAAEGVWMGWERKRGKLEELNRLLRGATDTSFMALSSPVPPDVVHVITLDADTRLLRDTVARMIGKMAHPLNRPRLDPDQQRVTRGYGILQPRVTPGLPMATPGSLYARVFSSPGGIEPYAAAVSDVYQDLWGEGSFTGKGIYHVDAFAAALAGRVPENAMLSHDLFEGIFARAGLASDIEVVEDFPTRQDVDARRQHRWVRGDWQLLPWIFGRRGRDIPPLGRAKMLDNLRRSLTAPLTFAALVAGWLLPPGPALIWMLTLLALFALPFLLPLPFAALPGRKGVTLRSHLAALGTDATTALARIGLGLTFLASSAWLMADAVLRTLLRLAVTRRHLLEWMTAAQSAGSGAPDLAASYRHMAGGVALALAAGGAVALNPSVWPVALPLVLLWLAAPLIAHRISQPTTPHAIQALTPAETTALRLIARRTWRYFETFVTEAENHLPPDNFQETPVPVVAHRTSPTNIGLYLLSVTVARDLGWCAEAKALERLEQTLTTMEAMARFRGHFFNWYDTKTLTVLSPAYVSSVDSGNLAGHLIALAQTCRDWIDGPEPDRRQGLHDTLTLARETASEPVRQQIDSILTSIESTLPSLEALDIPADAGEDLRHWLTAAREVLTTPPPADRTSRLEAIATRAQSLAMAMDFGFLFDPDKMLMSIGFSVTTNMLDPSCYDLLASEARLASLFAIAKGDAETRHWFRLGRSATPIGSGAVLLSWSGSMFEYLMPLLILQSPAGSTLEQTDRLIVQRQQSYAAALGLPWGISESSFNARDLEMTYQYSNFGVPGLGLKRGLADNRVIAPYATGLAAMVDPQAAVRNFAALAALGAEGRHGFYEAVDLTPERVPAGERFSLVRSFMAHHQGMTITAIANVLQGGALRARFHAAPMIKAVELLLQERVPRDAASTPPRPQDPRVAPTDTPDVPALRRFETPALSHPTAHLLSNGPYSTTLTPTGAGASRWRGLAITRWRAEPGREDLGSFIYLRDVLSGSLWSAGLQPLGTDGDRHSAQFCEHHAAFLHQGRRLTTRTEVVISSEDDAEARRVTLTNTGRHPREVDLTSYMELVLAPTSADLAHPAFSKMFVVTDFMPELEVIIATRRRRSDSDPEVWLAHIAVVEGEETAPVSFETSREKFIGRGRSLADAAMADAPLTGSMGTVLDPILALRRRVRIPPGGRSRVTFWTLVAESPADLLELVDRHRDPSAFDRAVTLAWTQGQVQLRHLGITHATARDFQRLAGVILRGDSRLRTSPVRVASGAGPQSLLWQFGISGDLPVVLIRIDDLADIGQVQEVLTAHEYWQTKQLAVDLVILNDRSSSYVQDLNNAVEAAVRSSQARPASLRQQAGQGRGAVHVLRSDLITAEAQAMLLSVAMVVLVAGHGGIGAHLDRVSPKRPLPPPAPPLPQLPAPRVPTPALLPDREFFNGLGGFAEGGREYVIVLDDGKTTPAPWCNVIANDGFGFQVSADGAGAVWAENSRENLLTPWSNDPVTDPPGEAIYLRDLETGAVWTPTAQPIRGPGRYVIRHGFGYSRFQHDEGGIEADLVQFVPVADPVKVSHLRLHNASGQTRRLSVTAYAEWVLGTTRSATAAHLVTEIDAETGAILATNPFGMAFPGRVAFADLGEKTRSRSADKTAFLGRGGTLADPWALRGDGLDGAAGAALDPCAALQRLVTIPPGGTVDVVFLIGQSRSAEEVRALIQRIRASDPVALLDEVRQHWTNLLTAVQVKTPDRAMDVMLNGWLLYQTLSSRIWARAGFYQASGAYGFRDQLQDGMALTASRPEMTRAHLLRAAARQFPEGDVQHWWLPHSGQGVRTRISDDRVWLGFGVAQYVEVSGDDGILDEQVPFLEGPSVPEGAHDAFYQPQVSDTSASLFEHVARGLDQAVTLTGANGMPLIGTGDWNDGMNRVGEEGRGTSVWLGWLLISTLRAMAPHAESRDKTRAARWRAHAEAVRKAIERDGWDGDWYRRATFDDGTILGTAGAAECRIDSIAQSWAVLSGAADPERADKAMASLTRHLIKPETGLALLFTPPFDQTAHDPGYIKAYPPGLRENGGQYSHAAMWAILAQARRGDGDAAAALFALVNPVNHARNPAATAQYRTEPYVVAADVYSTEPHVGRGGWTWYTGSAGWMYRAGVEGILGLTRRGQMLVINPCFPRHWPEVEAEVTYGTSQFSILVRNPHASGHSVASALLDGVPVAVEGGRLLLPMTKAHSRVEVTLGPMADADRDRDLESSAAE